MKPYYEDRWTKIYLGDCREILPRLGDVSCPDCGSDNFSFNPIDDSDYICKECGKWFNKFHVDLVLTDPPYPDQHLEYGDCDISFLDNEIVNCQQLVFWTAKCDFPLHYNAVHIWDKKTGCASEYERIFERNTERGNWKVFREYLINSSVAANYCHDVFTGHPSQKPFMLITKLIQYADCMGLILDPFMGSGSTCYCAKRLNRYSIGIEIEEKYCEIAAKRCSQSSLELDIPAGKTARIKNQQPMELDL